MKIVAQIWRRVFLRDFHFQLVHNEYLEAVGGEYEWQSRGIDPYFHLVPVDGKYPGGWVLLRTSLRRRAGDYSLKLYFDAGNGMSEQTSCLMSVGKSGEVNQLLRLPWHTRHLRWDPMASAGYLSQDPITISPIGLIGRWVHRIRQMRTAMQQYDRSELEARSITWPALMVRPQRTYEAVCALRNFVPETSYETWINDHALTDGDRRAIMRHIRSFAVRPLVSVVMPVYNTEPDFLRAAIDSVRAQLYDNWELCIADDASTRSEIRELLEDFRRREPRMKVAYRPVNGHISAATNTALNLADGEFIALLDHDDLLSEDALYQVVAEINRHPNVDIVYSDEDKIDEAGRRKDPHFKSDWNPDLLFSQNYISHLGVYRTSLVRSIGGFREGFEGSQDYDLLLRCTVASSPAHVRHVPAVIYHWRAVAGSTALQVEDKNYATDHGIKALKEHLSSDGAGVLVEAGRYQTTYRVRFPLPAPAPKVSLIIPTRDNCDMLRKCIRSIVEFTTYPNYEIVVVDNQSRAETTLRYFEELRTSGIRVLPFDQPFNYPAINNFAVEQVDGVVVGLVNNDIEVISPDWLDEMASHALRPDIGAVGAKLYYSDGTIQHAGVIVGLGGVAGHSHKYRARDDPGYQRRLFLTQNLSAVTGACLLVRRETYLQAGGLDSVNLAVAFNDVDFCLRLCEMGLRNVWTPYAELYHHESASRGPEDSPEKVARFQREIRYMVARWGERLLRDPYYSPMLTLDMENFQPDFRSSPPKPWLAPAAADAG